MSRPRRKLATILAVLMVCLLHGTESHGQAPATLSRVGVLGVGPYPDGGPLMGTLKEALRESGWIEGRNVQYDVAIAETFEGLAPPAMALVQRKAAVIVSMGLDEVTLAAKRATATIPIVMMLGVNPQRAGLIASLQRPGGNVTGILSDVSPDIWGKRLELLKDTLPTLSRVAVVWNPAVYAEPEEYWQLGTESARRLGLVLEPVAVRVPGDIEGAFQRISTARVSAVYVAGDPVTFFQRARLIEFARVRKIPVMYSTRTFVDDGGLMAYGPNLPAMVRDAARYVDRILRGANPAELPVERPTRFELVVNLKTAAALGLTIPPSVLGRADEVIP